MQKLCTVTKVKVLLLVLVYLFKFNGFEFAAAILRKGLLEWPSRFELEFGSVRKKSSELSREIKKCVPCKFLLNPNVALILLFSLQANPVNCTLLLKREPWPVLTLAETKYVPWCARIRWTSSTTLLFYIFVVEDNGRCFPSSHTFVLYHGETAPVSLLIRLKLINKRKVAKQFHTNRFTDYYRGTQPIHSELKE